MSTLGEEADALVSKSAKQVVDQQEYWVTELYPTLVDRFGEDFVIEENPELQAFYTEDLDGTIRFKIEKRWAIRYKTREEREAEQKLRN